MSREEDKLSNYMKNVYESNFCFEEERINEKIKAKSISFLSEWIFDEKILEYTGFLEKPLTFKPVTPIQYVFPDTNNSLNNSIKNFHFIHENIPPESFDIFISEGSTPMLTSVIMFAHHMGFKKIIGLFPLYFTIHKICVSLNMKIKHCNTDLAIFPESVINLPEKRSFLILTDPIWVVGRHHSYNIIKNLLEWQERTNSIIFVDGSFQYMDWGTEKKKELTSLLNPDLTIRLVCPTKALCLHGIRFSYLICPKRFSHEICRISIVVIGSSCYYSHTFRERIFNEMIKPEINPVGAFSLHRFNLLKPSLIKNEIDYINPDCGFFMYADLEDFFRKKKILSKFYWLSNIALDIPNSKYDGYAKINLIATEKTYNSFLKAF